MIATKPQRFGGRKDAHVQGWLVSVLLHSTVALAAILTMKHIPLAPQDDAFTWNVAMVSPAQPTASSSNQAPARSVQSTTSTPAPPVRKTAPTQTLSSPQPLAPQTVPSISERPAATVVTEPPPPLLTTPSPPATQTLQPAEPISQETVAPRAAEADAGVRPDEPPMAVATSTEAGTGSSSPQSTMLRQTAQSDHAPTETQLAANTPARRNVPAKRDYGWLSETILRRVEELKRYPASARVERAEGKVVVKAVIDEDGSIGEVEVFQSSGYPTLDEAAMDTMRQAAPVHLPHPLGQPRMTIKIPMSYRLDR
ncbi:MAG TPA: TonB family protein [Nitrospiraceae bacterium]|nr:TonB family protein [Nitrospiraceae bacterium]